MSNDDATKELKVFQQVVSGLSSLDKESQVRILESVVTFLHVDLHRRPIHASSQKASIILGTHSQEPLPSHGGSVGSDLTPKEFLLEKEPRTDIERIACLAYFLTHYRDTPHFKTLDLSKLNTEAAQQKFTNAAQSVKNTTTKNLIVHVGKRQKQISAAGEQFVHALPNREAAKLVLQRMKPKHRKSPRGEKRTSKYKR